MKSRLITGLPLSACVLTLTLHATSFAATAQMQIDADDIGGVVKSAKGPEAGVWVIAETRDLPTKFSRTVVTDDQGRYVVPDLPKANYKIWVRGYGLIDSKPVDAAPGKTVDLIAVVAPTPAAAAEYYPPSYWAAMIKVPSKSEFPGTGPKGNGIAPDMHTQRDWTHLMMEGCAVCHQLGDKATRTLAPEGNSMEAWDRRVQRQRPDVDIGLPPSARKGSVSAMSNKMSLYGRGRGLAMFADWTDRINKGELPAAVPPRPQGLERNVVVTVRDFGSGHFAHDQVASSRQDPNVNANGPLYGVTTNHSTLEVLDPVSNTTKSLKFPGPNGEAVDTTVNPHHAQMDDKGRVWMAGGSGGSRLAKMPAFCTDGSTPYSKYFPISEQVSSVGELGETYNEVPRINAGRVSQGLGGSIPMYDPATQTMHQIVICQGGDHVSVGWDPDQTVYLSMGTKVMSWLKSRVWDETHDISKAHGWCPMVLDTNGDGKIDADRNKWNAWGKPLDPKKDTLFDANIGYIQHGGGGFMYGLNVDQKGILWGGVNNRPYIIRMDLGANPPETCMSEVYAPPMINGEYQAFGARGISVDSQGVAWVAFSSGQIGSFDRRKCKVINGPTAIGGQCPEGWKLYTLPGPTMKGSDRPFNYVYGVPPDFYDVMGLGKDALFLPSVNTNSIVAFDPKAEKFYDLAVPYPAGMFPRDTHYRIDNPKTGWKGRSLFAAYSEIAVWHQEEGEGSEAKIAQIQIRPDPLAH